MQRIGDAVCRENMLTRAPQAGQYTHVHQFRKKNNMNPLQPIKWRDKMAKVDKILFILAILYKPLHMVLGSGDADGMASTNSNNR